MEFVGAARASLLGYQPRNPCFVEVSLGQRKLRRSRDCGAGTQEARPSRPPQTPWRGFRVSQEAGRAWRADPSATAGFVDSAGVRTRRAPADDRASTRRKKNCKVTSATAQQCSTEPPAVM